MDLEYICQIFTASSIKHVIFKAWLCIDQQQLLSYQERLIKFSRTCGMPYNIKQLGKKSISINFFIEGPSHVIIMSHD